jgi:hypothetical protein
VVLADIGVAFEQHKRAWRERSFFQRQARGCGHAATGRNIVE